MDRRVKELLARQAVWQRARASLPWEEKLRMSLFLREARRALRGGAKRPEPKGLAQPSSGDSTP